MWVTKIVVGLSWATPFMCDRLMIYCNTHNISYGMSAIMCFESFCIRNGIVVSTVIVLLVYVGV